MKFFLLAMVVSCALGILLRRGEGHKQAVAIGVVCATVCIGYFFLNQI
jgi:hypothetical protein